LNADVEGAHSIGFHMVLGVGLVEERLKHELPFDEPIVVKSVFEVRVAFITFFYDQIDETWDVDVRKNIEVLALVEVNWVLVAEG
jgi:hypothetical protein